jgi:hypothetical protein
MPQKVGQMSHPNPRPAPRRRGAAMMHCRPVHYVMDCRPHVTRKCVNASRHPRAAGDTLLAGTGRSSRAHQRAWCRDRVAPLPHGSVGSDGRRRRTSSTARRSDPSSGDAASPARGTRGNRTEHQSADVQLADSLANGHICGSHSGESVLLVLPWGGFLLRLSYGLVTDIRAAVKGFWRRCRQLADRSVSPAAAMISPPQRATSRAFVHRRNPS